MNRQASNTTSKSETDSKYFRPSPQTSPRSRIRLVLQTGPRPILNIIMKLCARLHTFHLMRQLVRRRNSKFRANCALFDTSMKFGTLIVDTKTSIFRYSARPELRGFPWKPQFINISLLGFVSTIISVVLTFRCTFCFIWRIALIPNYALSWQWKT